MPLDNKSATGKVKNIIDDLLYPLIKDRASLRQNYKLLNKICYFKNRASVIYGQNMTMHSGQNIVNNQLIS